MDPTKQQTHKLKGMIMFEREFDEPKHPGSLATDRELCEHWHALDVYFSTSEMSPLHHDNRCEVHAPDLTATEAYRLTHGFKFTVSNAA